jgi:hypothetical protein
VDLPWERGSAEAEISPLWTDVLATDDQHARSTASPRDGAFVR